MTARNQPVSSAFSQITSATTTAVKAKGGTVRRVVVFVTTASTITFNDTIGAVFTMPASVPVGTYDLGIDFRGKIEVVTAGASNLLVLYD